MRLINNFLLAELALLLSAFVSGSFLSIRAQNNSAPSVQFVDVASLAGLRDRVVNGGEVAKKYIFESTGSGVAVFDYDSDDHPDIFLVNGSRLEGFSPGQHPTNHLYHNKGDGTFVDVTAQSGLGHSGWGHGVCVGDYDNDGNTDLFVTYYDNSNLLYHNDGKGRFSDVTQKAGLESGPRNWGSGCTFVDYDKDGFLDLFVASYVDMDPANTPLPGANSRCLWKGVPVYCGPRGLKAPSNHLYHNNRNGSFTEVSLKAGIQANSDCYGLSVAAADFQNRGWPDIFVACDSTPSLMYHNNGDGTFRDVGVESGLAFNQDGFLQAGMGVYVGDYDGDGRLDILKTTFENDVPALYRNDGNGIFTFNTFDAKLGSYLKYLSWGGGFFDFDNDGWLDLFIANGHVYPEPASQGLAGPYRQRSLLYHNQDNGTFDDVTKLSGAGLELERSARGVAFGDFDNDGDIDIVINNQNDPPTLLKNEGGNRENSLEIRLKGTKSNRDGIGARVSVLARQRKRIDEVRSGGSYLSQSDFCLHFGLGKVTVAELVEVRWPSGAIDQLKNVSANRRILIEEGKGLVRDFSLPQKN